MFSIKCLLHVSSPNPQKLWWISKPPLTYKTTFQNPLILKSNSELIFLKKKCYENYLLPGHKSLTTEWSTKDSMRAYKKYYIVFTNGKYMHYIDGTVCNDNQREKIRTSKYTDYIVFKIINKCLICQRDIEFKPSSIEIYVHAHTYVYIKLLWTRFKAY